MKAQDGSGRGQCWGAEVSAGLFCRQKEGEKRGGETKLFLGAHINRAFTWE